ncbi:hypothetical protein BV917_16100 [Leptospira santarosai serovar Guaricura]|nr:hypothetical protein BV917_16100 [Leptospira santarosai serovar Guaricura]
MIANHYLKVGSILDQVYSNLRNWVRLFFVNPYRKLRTIHKTLRFDDPFKNLIGNRFYSELYNRVSKILLQNGDWTQNKWYSIL